MKVIATCKQCGPLYQGERNVTKCNKCKMLLVKNQIENMSDEEKQKLVDMLSKR